jgi:uncharacterized repeat protein (TIGR01451 family)
VREEAGPEILLEDRSMSRNSSRLLISAILFGILAGTSPLAAQARLSATKLVGGFLTPGGSAVYTVTLSNGGSGAQTDNAGHEFRDVLPAKLILISATATSGTVVATPASGTVTWDGSIPPNGSVTITITATISASALPGSTISNQGTIAYDLNGDGTNEAAAFTDDPSVIGAANPTTLQVLPADLAIPTLGTVGLALLTLLLALGGAAMLRRRRI